MANKLEQEGLLESFFTSSEDDANDPSAMTLVEHLEELRWRIFKSVIALVITSIVAFIFRGQIVYLLELPLPTGQADVIGHKLVVTGLMEGFTVFLMISVAAGFILA